MLTPSTTNNVRREESNREVTGGRYTTGLPERQQIGAKRALSGLSTPSATARLSLFPPESWFGASGASVQRTRHTPGFR